MFTAEDGTAGLHAAQVHKPEIILSDVRMPRMDGIEMLNRVRKTMPDTVFIFMSGYSDKEYLKAAIRLHAVSYIEKPLDLDEVRDAVREAVGDLIDLRQSRDAREVRDNVSSARLALFLTMPYNSVQESVDRLSAEYCRKYGSVDLFHAAATILLQIDERDELSPDFSEREIGRLHDFIRTSHLHIIGAEKRTNLFVFHIFRKMAFSGNTILSVIEYMKKTMPAELHYYIAAGNVVSGLKKLYTSYSSAVIVLQQCFFCEPGTALTADNPLPEVRHGRSLDEITRDLSSAIDEADAGGIHAGTEELYHLCSRNPSLMHRSVQSVYFQLIARMQAQSRRRQLSGSGTGMEDESSLDILDKCFSFDEQHRYLTDSLDRYLQQVHDNVPENTSVYLIKSYIQSHYQDPMLSTKEISESASLSASYACTVFKNETGQTLNQYLTSFRMEKSKKLLEDPHLNVSDIAAMVGYNDSNYFGKAFKKYVGTTPSEYRESRLK